MPKTVIHDIQDLTEPNIDNGGSFNLNLKQINFIRNDNNIEFMNNIMKIMKIYKLEVDDFKKIIEDYQKNEIKKQERNELRKSKRNEQKNTNNDDSDDDIKSILSNRSSNKNNRKIKRSNSRKR